MIVSHSKSEEKMTLIIGFKCSEGIALVSDTKIVDMETGEASFESKILTPLENTPFIVGAAGYVNLFNEFNRKIPGVVTNRIAQIRVLNVQELLKTGLTRQQAIKYIHAVERCATTSLRLVQDSEKFECKELDFDVAEIELPHVYSEENFIDDCKSLVKKINSQSKDVSEPLELLIGIRRPSDGILHLHHIDSEGVEDEISDYFSIGSGYPFVKTFFSQVYDFSKGMNELVTQAFRTILYVTIVAKESSIGYSRESPPKSVIILNDGKYGKMTFENEWQVIDELEKEMENFVYQIKHNKISELKSKIDSKVVL